MTKLEKLVNPRTANLECSNISLEGKSKNFSLFKIKDQYYYSVLLLLSPLWWPSQMHHLLSQVCRNIIPTTTSVCVCMERQNWEDREDWGGTRASHKQFIFSNALQWATPFYHLRYLATLKLTAAFQEKTTFATNNLDKNGVYRCSRSDNQVH